MNFLFIFIPVFVLMASGFGLWFYHFQLPALLEYMAGKVKWMVAIKENTIIFIERSGGFIFLVVKIKGEKPIIWAKDKSLIPFHSTELSAWGRWFLKRGIVWLGFEAPALIKKSSITIPATRLVEKSKRGEKLITWIKTDPKPIWELEMKFPVYVVIENVELTDTTLADFLALAYVEIPPPILGDDSSFEAAYQFWYVLRGKAFEALRTEIERSVRVLAQGLSYALLRDGSTERLMEEILNTPSTRKVTGLDGKTMVEGSLPDTVALVGAPVVHLTVEEWKNDEPDGETTFRDLVQGPKVQALKLVTALAAQETERGEAVARVETAAKEEEAWKAEQKAYAARWNAIVAKAGSKKAAAVIVLKQELGDPAFMAYCRKEGLIGTGLGTLVESGAATNVIIGATPKANEGSATGGKES